MRRPETTSRALVIATCIAAVALGLGLVVVQLGIFLGGHR